MCFLQSTNIKKGEGAFSSFDVIPICLNEFCPGLYVRKNGYCNIVNSHVTYYLADIVVVVVYIVK